MKRRRLRQLAKNPENIEGIYNFCDRWCERCAFTSRCLLFRMEQDAPPTESEKDLEDPAFAEKMSETFRETMEMVREDAAEQGIDLDAEANSPQLEVEMRCERRREARAAKDGLAAGAEAYVKAFHLWFGKHQNLFEQKQQELGSQVAMRLPGTSLKQAERAANDIVDAVEVVQWYHMQIAVKLHRATMSKLAMKDEGDDADERESHSLDADASAKIALIGLDRSIDGWTRLREHLSADDSDSILDLLALLSKIRKRTEAEFPEARKFIRPGFDDGTPIRVQTRN